MAIIGAHALLYTSEPEKVRAIFKDVFKFSYVDAGDGWLIYEPRHETAIALDRKR